MRNKKLISRVLVFMLAIILTLTFIPPNLIASALGGIGGGQSGNGKGGGGVGNNDSLLNQDVGLRFSLVTLKNGKRTVVETKYSGKYFIDVWCNDNGEYCNPLFIPHIKKPTGLYFFCLFSEKLIRSTFEGVIIN